MGIFKDFATSPLGDFTIGALSEFEDRAARDVVVNATASQNSLDKETKAFNEYETAFKNKQEIANIFAANPEAFGLSMQEGLDINQVADRFSNFMFKQNRSIFEGTDMDKVKLNVAKFMAANPGQGFTIYDPYIAGEDRFKREQELHQARLSAITKMPRADKLLMNIQKAEEGVATPESITDELTNGIAAAKTDEERQLLNNQLNQLVLEQHKTMDTYSKSAGTLMAGMDRSEVFPSETETGTGTIPLPLAAEGYVPRINNEGDLIIQFANGNTDALDLEMLVNSPESVKLLPIQAQNYINTIKDRFFVDGQMTKPTREMFQPGAAGDKAFNDFLNIHKVLGIQEEMDLATAGGMGEIESPPKSNLKDADITQLKEKVTGDEIKIEELPSANTIVPKKKPDQPDQPKEKSLSDKIQEDFPNANVGISGGDVNVEEGTKKKTDTQTQTEDVFEGSGVEPMFQSARFKFRNIDQGYLVDQWSSNYQTEGSMIKRLKANKDLILGSNNAIPADAAKQIDLVASAFDGDNNFSKDQITEILGAIGFIESDGYKYKKQGLNRIDDGKGVARSYWQVEPSTAESILDENLNVMKGGGNPFLGANFEKLFRSKYADQIGSGTALEYFAKLNRKELSDLLLKDGLFAASMAAHKVVTTFDPFNSKGA